MAEGVTRKYGDVIALDGVSLTVGDGEIFALIGPNGAGKTTFVRALTGTTVPDAGRITVLGRPPRAVDRGRIGLLPQAFTPPTRLTVTELLQYYAGLYEGGRPIDALIEEVGMADREDVRYERLSGGQQRRVCIAISLVNDPSLLFLDEPTTGIDPAGRRDLWALLDELSETGTTIFLTTHDMQEAEVLADRVGLLSEGRLIEVGRPSDLIRNHGGESRLLVETGNDLRPLLDRGHRVSRSDGTVTIHGIDPHDIGPTIAELEEAGIDYEALTWREPTLEDVYLSLTGERYRPRPETEERQP